VEITSAKSLYGAPFGPASIGLLVCWIDGVACDEISISHCCESAIFLSVFVGWGDFGFIFLGFISFLHQRASDASGDSDVKYIPGIIVLIPGIARFQFTVQSSKFKIHVVFLVIHLESISSLYPDESMVPSPRRKYSLM
jgi:hypothetical protein